MLVITRTVVAVRRQWAAVSTTAGAIRVPEHGALSASTETVAPGALASVPLTIAWAVAGTIAATSTAPTTALPKVPIGHSVGTGPLGRDTPACQSGPAPKTPQRPRNGPPSPTGRFPSLRGVSRPTLSSDDPCPFGRCDGSGFIIDEERNEATVCQCRPLRIDGRRARDLSGVIPKRYRGVSFDRPPVTEIAAPVVTQVRRYVRDLDDNLAAGRGLWLFGDVGTGKTTLAMLVSSHALEAGKDVAIYSLPRLLAEIRTTFDDASERSYVELLDRLGAVDLLHIDDLGAEKTSPWVLEQLYAIVNARYEDQRAMLITTNLPREELVEQIGERTVSRLEEMCEELPLYGADQRQQTYGLRPV